MYQKKNFSKQIEQTANEAFERYWGMQENRSLKSIAELMKRPLRTVEMWSKKYNWSERIATRQEEINKKIAKETDETVQETKRMQFKIVKQAITKLLIRMQDQEKIGTLPDFSYNDLEKMLRHQLLLQGALYDQQPTINPLTFVSVNLSPAGQTLDSLLKSLTPEVRVEVIRAARKLSDKGNTINAGNANNK